MGNYRDAESDVESEDEVPCRRRRSSEIPKNSGNQQHQQHSYKRIKREINYKDAESDEGEEGSEDEVPISRRTNRGRSQRVYVEKESSSEVSEDDRSLPQNDDLSPEEEEEENLGRRRGSRRRVQVNRQPRLNARPQRTRHSSGAHYREASSDEEFPLPQNRRSRHSVLESRQTQEEPPAQAGVSMRGRVRRPNPRLYE